MLNEDKAKIILKSLENKMQLDKTMRGLYLNQISKALSVIEKLENEIK